MEKLSLHIAFPFRLDGRPEDWPECIFQYNSRLKQQYHQALLREVRAAASDAQESVIQSIHLDGCFFLMEYEQLMDLAACIRQSFTLADDCRWNAHCEPGRLNTGVLNFCKNINMHSLCFDYRTSSAPESAAMGFPSPRVEMEHSKEVMQHSVFRHFALQLSDRHYNLTMEQWKISLRDSISFDPEVIYLDINPDSAYAATAHERLISAGYRSVSSDPDEHTLRYIRKDLPDPTDPLCAGSIGCGLGAMTKLESLTCRNTLDLNLYLRESGHIEKIAVLLTN